MRQLPQRERTDGTWMSHDTARESVLLQILHVGAFVRALLPVHLSGGDTITFGGWLAIDPRDQALLAAPVVAQVLDGDAMPCGRLPNVSAPTC